MFWIYCLCTALISLYCIYQNYYNSTTPIKDIVSAHFTVCQKPWSCAAWQQNPLCVALHKRFDALSRQLVISNIWFHFRWFELRIEAEKYFSIPVPNIKKHCAQGRAHYQPIDGSSARVPDSFMSRFNKITIPSYLQPTCGSGFADESKCFL